MIKLLEKIRKKGNSVYVFFLLSYVSILLITLSSSFFYYNRINNLITHQTELSKVTLLNQLKEKTDDNISYVKNLGNNIAFNNKLLAIAKGFSLYSKKELMQELSSKTKPPDYLVDFFVYLKKSDEIITSYVNMSAESFFSAMYKFEDMDYTYFHNNYLLMDHFQEFMPTVKMHQYENDLIDVIPYVLTFPVSGQGESLGQVVVFINAQSMFSLASQLSQVSDSYIYILDKNNNVILSTMQAPKLDLSMYQGMVKTITTRDYIITGIQSDISGWKYISSTPKSVYFKSNTEYLTFFFAIFFIYLVIGLAIIRILARRSYNPIKEIHNLISFECTQDDNTSGNEYDAIKHTWLQQIRNDHELNCIIEQQMPIVRHDFFVQLLKGVITNEKEIILRLDNTGIKFDSNIFYVILAEIDMDCPFINENPDNMEQHLSLSRLIIKNISLELLDPCFQCYYLDLARNQGALLLSVKNSVQTSDAVKNISEYSRTLIEIARDNFNLYINVGASTEHYGIKNVPTCYDEANKALNSCRLTESDKAVFFDELDSRDNDYYYPVEIEYQMVDYLRKGQASQAKELLNVIFEINTKSKQLDASAAQSLLYAIALTMDNIIRNNLMIRSMDPLSEPSIVDRLPSNAELTAMKDFFYEIIDYVVQLTLNGLASKTEKLVNHIVEYIEKNAGEKWIDLNILSSEVHVTPQYISSVFKKYKNENVKDYINKIMLEKAKELIKTTDMSVKDIAFKIGYSNEVGIIRLFKKYENITPGDYRRIYREN